MKRKLMLFAAALLSALWSQTGLATCSVENNTSSWDDRLHLLRRTAGQMIVQYGTISVRVVCDRRGGWFELTPAKAFSPSPLGNGIITTNVDFVGISLNADLLNEDTNGHTKTMLTDGSFTSRRWVIPANEDSPSIRRFYAIKTNNNELTYWAIGPEDPKPGAFDTAPYFTLTTDDGITTPVGRFTNKAMMVASCAPWTSYNDGLITLNLSEAYTNEFPTQGRGHQVQRFSDSIGLGYDCDRDINVQFTFTATNTIPGFPNLLAPEPGGPEGVGIMLSYRISNPGGPIVKEGEITLGEPFNIFDDSRNSVAKASVSIKPNYYRYGNTEVTPGHFRTTATMNVQFQ